MIMAHQDAPGGGAADPKGPATMKRARPLALVIVIALAAALGSATAPAQEVDCTVGNLNEPAFFAPDIFTGEQAFAYLVLPAERCAFAGGHFSLLNVTQLLHFEPQQLPTTLQVEAAILAAVWDPAAGCWIPGEPLHVSLPLVRPVEAEGIQAVTVQLDPLILPLEEFYFLSLRYSGGGPAQLVTDDMPEPCIEYIDRGQGWEDLFTFDKTGDGKGIVFGDIVYATQTVPEEARTWGAIKSLYR
jgi:hypothetical protein